MKKMMSHSKEREKKEIKSSLNKFFSPESMNSSVQLDRYAYIGNIKTCIISCIPIKVLQ